MGSDALALQTTWIRSFLAVAEQGGFGAATTVLHLSQSRVSAHIAALEHALGVTLFDRTERPIRVTPAGEAFQQYAVAAIESLQSGVDAARSAAEDVVGRIAIGSYPSVSATHLPGVLQRLTVAHPGIEVLLHEGNAAALEEMVSSGTVDVAFRPLEPRMREVTLAHDTLWREDIVAVLREQDPLAERASITVDELAERPLIGNPAGTEAAGGGFDLRRVLGARAPRATVAYLTDQPATLAALVRSGFGVGVINRLAMNTTGTGGLVIRRIDAPAAHRDVALYWLRRRTDSAAVRAFRQAQRGAVPPAGVTALRP